MAEARAIIERGMDVATAILVVLDELDCWAIVEVVGAEFVIVLVGELGGFFDEVVGVVVDVEVWGAVEVVVGIYVSNHSIFCVSRK